jgi:hypothetical protein
MGSRKRLRELTKASENLGTLNFNYSNSFIVQTQFSDIIAMEEFCPISLNELATRQVPMLLSQGSFKQTVNLTNSLYRSLFRASWKNHILFNPYPLKILPLPE